MTPSKNNQGLLVFEKKGSVYLFWSPARSSFPGVFSVESRSGRVFTKPSSSVTFYTARGAKIVPGPESMLRASTLGTKTVLSFVDDKDQTVFFESARGGSWKAVATPSLFDGPTVAVKLPVKNGQGGRIVAFSTRGGRGIFQASSSGALERFRDEGIVLGARRSGFDTTALSPFYAEILPQGILLVYSAKNSKGRLVVGAALFDRAQPEVLLWRSDEALWEGVGQGTSTIIGGANIGKYFFLYLHSSGKSVAALPVARYWETVRERTRHEFVLPPRKKGKTLPLAKAESNPVLEPLVRNSWEAFATFNPAAILIDDCVHLLYRAQGYDGLSVLGHASSRDGVRIDERGAFPAFVSPSVNTGEDPDKAYPCVSGGGTGGCEDPRLVLIGDTVYLIYIAFDGLHPPGVALSHIAKDDFAAKRWKWSRPRLISQPGKIQKNWVLFPEKIQGKYAVLHGLSPKIRIEYIDDPKKLGHGRYIESLSSHGGQGYVEAARLHAWDNIVRGVGAPPLWTKYGWLVFYHGMDMRDPGKYKVGVMLLDLEDPERILRRSLEPVLEPTTEYENNGHKRGVIYVCGAVIKEGNLYVYYGAADRTTAVARASLETFLQSLLRDVPPRLKKMNLRKIR